MFKIVNKPNQKFLIKSERGQIAKTLLALAIVILIALGIAYIVVNKAKPKPPVVPQNGNETQNQPIYEATIGDIRFIFLEAKDKGNTLYGKDSNYPNWQKDLKTTERFIEVVVGAQNVGKVNTEERDWDLGNIIDSEGRVFVPSGSEVNSWLPSYQEDLCGSVLKPSFEPSPCKKIYEVAKVSTGLKIEVLVYKKRYTGNEVEKALLDILLMP